MNPARIALDKLPENARDAILTVAYAVIAAISAIAFMLATNAVFNLIYGNLAKLGVVPFALASLGVIAATSLLVGLLLAKASPQAAGSGVPQLKAAYWKDLGYLPFRSVWAKFVAGILSIGGGASLGREGPSIFTGGGAASNLAGLLGAPKQGRRTAAVAGAAASLAAAFNTPLAAITFVIEELLGELSGRALGAVVLSAVTGALLVHAIIGPQPAFSLPDAEGTTWLMYLVVPLVALAASFLGVVFQRLALALRSRSRNSARLPLWLKPLLGGLIAWAVGVAAFAATGRIGVFGLGYGDLSSALDGKLAWGVAGGLVAAKLVATTACYGFEGSGGIFSPTLFLGGLCGYFIAGLAGLWLPLSQADKIVLAAVGMSACFNSVVRAPLTSTLMVFEMTHQFAFVPALMICALISLAVSRFAGRHNFYDTLLLQDGHELVKIKPPRHLKAWQSLAVSEIAKAEPVFIQGLSAPVLRAALAKHPYNRFPVLRYGKIEGIATRKEIEAALSASRPPALLPPAFCRPGATVKEVGELLIATPAGMVLVEAEPGGRVLSVVTLHDLLRAQAAFAE